MNVYYAFIINIYPQSKSSYRQCVCEDAIMKGPPPPPPGKKTYFNVNINFRPTSVARSRQLTAQETLVSIQSSEVIIGIDWVIIDWSMVCISITKYVK